LQERVDDGPMPVQEAVHVATEVERGLPHARAEGVARRDLKPSNVLVTNKGQVKILDFGMAHAFGRRRVTCRPRRPGRESGRWSLETVWRRPPRGEPFQVILNRWVVTPQGFEVIHSG
jgi:serine/threonine protein kinase